MRNIFLVVGLLFLSFFVFTPVVSAQQLSIVAPAEESVTSFRVDLKFAVSDFTLTARPEEASNSGVIAVYLDGKFYTHVATDSAVVQLPRLGTHKIEAELVGINREPIVPRVSSHVYVHYQKKTPYLQLTNVRTGATIYSDTPTFALDFRKEQFEDQSTYYQVFIDGVVDGDSQELTTPAMYTVKQALTPGRHTVRVALYTENGRPYSPVIETLSSFTYVEDVPTIASVSLPDTIVPGETVAFSTALQDFRVPEDGYLVAKTRDRVWKISSESGELVGMNKGNTSIEFALVDRNGFGLVPAVRAEKTVVYEELAANVPEAGSLSGFFMTGAEGNAPRWGLLAIGVIQAVVILIFGVVLTTRHHKKK